MRPLSLCVRATPESELLKSGGAGGRWENSISDQKYGKLLSRCSQEGLSHVDGLVRDKECVASQSVHLCTLTSGCETQQCSARGLVTGLHQLLGDVAASTPTFCGQNENMMVPLHHNTCWYCKITHSIQSPVEPKQYDTDTDTNFCRKIEYIWRYFFSFKYRKP